METSQIKSMKELEGQLVLAIIPIFHPTSMQKLRLHKVEPFGIWVESQQIMEIVFRQAGVSHSPTTLIFFLPWQQITFVMGELDVPGISEKALSP